MLKQNPCFRCSPLLRNLKVFMATNIVSWSDNLLSFIFEKIFANAHIWIAMIRQPVTLSRKNGIAWKAAANSVCSWNQSPIALLQITVIFRYSGKSALYTLPMLSPRTVERSRSKLLGNCFRRCLRVNQRILRASRAVGVGPLNAEPTVQPWSLLMVNELRDSSYKSNVLLHLDPAWLAKEDFSMSMKLPWLYQAGDPEL